jgi:hypothetical protein
MPQLDSQRLFDAVSTGSFFAPWLALFVANLVGLGLLRLYARGRRGSAIALLCALLWGVGSQFFMVCAQTVSDYAFGHAHLTVAHPGNPDPATRLEEDRGSWFCCVCDPRWDRWSNNVLVLLTMAFGPTPGGYLGPYPSGPEARALLAMASEPVVLTSNEEVKVGEHSYAIEPVNLDEVAELEAACECTVWRPQGWSLTSADFERGEVTAAVSLAHDALLVQRSDTIELRTWDRWSKGEVFASWPFLTEAPILP